MRDLLRKIQKTIDTHKMLEPGDRVLVGVSGGSDSVALGHVLHQLAPRYRLSLHWVHVNHQLRTDSIPEEEFVRKLAEQLGAAFSIERIHPKEIAVRDGRSLEEVARELRLEVFRRVGYQVQANSLALGHHSEDQAETVLMRIIRGSGLTGLGAMEPVRMWKGMKVIRPLLDCTKQELREWLKANEIPWCEDSTNQDVRYFRNKIRLDLLPRLKKEYNNKIQERLCSLAACVQGDEEYLIQVAQRFFAEMATLKEGRVEIPLNLLKVLPTALKRRVSRLAVEQIQGHLRRIGFKHWLELEDLYDHRPGRSIVHLPQAIAVQKLHKKIIFYRGTINARSQKTTSTEVSAARA